MNRLPPNIQTILILMLFILLSGISGQNPYVRFYPLTIEDGLSQNTVSSIIQDKHGFLWFGTEDGLNKYDGYDFAVYRHDPADSSSISSNNILSLYEDSKGFLWVGTKDGGLNKFDQHTATFTHLKYDREDTSTLSDNQVLSMCEDSNGNIWVGTWEGLNKLNPSTGEVNRYYNESNDVTTLSDNRIKSILCDSQNRLWIGTAKNGVCLYSPDSDAFERYLPSKDLSQPKDIRDIYEDNNNDIWFATESGIAKYNQFLNTIESISDSAPKNIMQIIQDKNSNLWFCTEKEGLTRYHTKDNTFQIIKNIPANRNSLSSNTLLSLYYDRDGNLWIGTKGGGINRMNLSQSFDLYSSIPGRVNSLRYPSVKAIKVDGDSLLWIGYQNGIDIIDLTADEKTNNDLISRAEKEIPIISVLSFASDHKGNFWVGTDGSGLLYFDFAQNKYINFESNNLRTSISNNTIYDITIDQKDMVWLATAKGISRIDASRAEYGEFKSYFSDLGLRSFDGKNVFTTIVEHPSGDGSFLAGTENAGVIRFHPENQKLTYFRHNEMDTGSISSNQIHCITSTSDNEIWIGTSAGLNKYIPANNSFITITEKDGLPNNLVYGIVEDNVGDLWISTNSGISRFNLKNWSIANYDTRDGLQSNEFNARAFSKDQNGNIYFGGIAGLNVIPPEKVKIKALTSKTRITNITINNQVDQEKEKDYLTILEDQESILQLSHLDRALTLDFVSLYYQNPEKIQYAYMLEGFDNKWITTSGKNRRASFTHLPSGEYTFIVKSSLDGKNWFEPATRLGLTVNPAPWRTWSAYIFYATILIGLLYFIRRYEIRRITLKSELSNERFESAKRQELDKLKSQFYENISHEFRTPLTLIKGRHEEILSNLSKSQQLHLKKHFDSSLANTKKLERLINELLDLSKLEAGSLKIKKSRKDFRQIVNQSTDSFIALCKKKKIEIKVSNPDHPVMVFIDSRKIEHVMENLLFNAIDFTPTGGWIDIGVSIKESFVECCIRDSGEGIPEKALGHIFERFYQADTSLTRSHEGSGIGLALVKDIVEIHDGTITVESKLGEGALFTFVLPLDIRTEEILEKDGVLPKDIQNTTDTENRERKPQVKSILESRPRVLVIEDNSDMVDYIYEILKGEFQVFTANDGLAGLNRAKEILPDLIVSDIMMPELDGLALLQKIRGDNILSHIPVILLTARADNENRIEGLEFQADAYMTKPFEAKELQAQISNLLKSRKKLKKTFASSSIIPDSNIKNIDQEFLDKAQESVRKNMANQSYSVEDMAKALFLSSRQTERRMKDLTGLAPSTFIKRMRIQYAKHLLENGLVSTVSEAAIAVSYSQVKYFTRLFKNEFGELPAKFIRRN